MKATTFRRKDARGFQTRFPTIRGRLFRIFFKVKRLKRMIAGFGEDGVWGVVVIFGGGDAEQHYLCLCVVCGRESGDRATPASSQMLSLYPFLVRLPPFALERVC